MGDGESCVRIVEVKSGQRTGETIYVTEDGRRWTSEVPGDISQLTGGGGQVLGYVRGDRMCNHR